MRKLEEVERTVKNYFGYGSVFLLLLLYVIYAPIVSLIVTSFVLFIILTILNFIELLVGWRVWKNGLEMDTQHRVMGFFTIFNIGLYSVMPLFFLSFGTVIFWITLSIYLLLLGFLLTKTKIIAEGIHNPSESKIGMAFLIAAVVIVFVVIPARNSGPVEGFVMSLLNDSQKEFYVFSAMYLLGLLLTFILPVFFYPVQFNSEEHPKGRRKLTRAKRKAQKAKRN